jgi:hypothetical protein
MDDEALRKLAETLIDESFDAWIWILNEAQRGNQENALRYTHKKNQVLE